MLRHFVPTRADVRALFQLAVPMVIVQVGIMAMGVVDTVFVAHVSARELAAATLGNLYVFGLAVFSMGTLWGLDPVIAQAMGARDHEGAALGIQRGIVLALGLGSVMTLFCLPAQALFGLMHQPADVVPRAAGFVWMSAPSMIVLLVFASLRQSLQAMKHTDAIVVTLVIGNLVNVALDWMLVFGHFGLPAMGALGAGLASTIGRWVMTLILLFVSRRELGPMLRPWRAAATARAPMLATLRLGLPVGIQSSVEFTMFSSISLFAGWFGAEAIGGHSVALNLSSLTFMVPMGVGGAAAVLVGHAIGEGDAPHARRLAASALAVGAGFMSLCAVTLLLFPGTFAHLYSSVPGVVAIASTLIPIAGVFQVFDGLQVVSAGVLRGAGDTRAPMLANLVGYGAVGMPVSLWLGFGRHLGVVGLWWGFVAGLAAVAAFLVVRVRIRLMAELARVRVH